MRVLFLASDGLSAPLRIRPLLEHLRSAGQIDDFAVVDRDLAMTGSGSAFDVVLVHRSPGSRQIAWLTRSGLPFVYDIDDLLLGDPTGLDRRRAQEHEAIRWCLVHAQTVTSPSRRLLATLERRLGESFGDRAVYLPNAGCKPIAKSAPPLHPPRLLWVSTHGRHFDELCDVGAGIAAAARAIGTEVTLVGRFPNSVLAAIPGHVHVPWLEADEYEKFLAHGSFIAAVPLPTDVSSTEREFLACKSDVKAAQFCSLGIAALYSSVPPYTESDLPCVIAPTNAAADWQRRLVELAKGFPGEGEKLAHHPALAARRRQVIARQLFDVLVRARAAVPFEFRATPTPTVLRSLEQGIRSIRSRLLR